MTSTADHNTGSDSRSSGSGSASDEPEPTQAISAQRAERTERTDPTYGDEPVATGSHPLDDPRPVVEDEEPVRRGRGLGAGRHITSTLLCLIAVVAAYGAVDYGFYRANVAVQADLLPGRLPDDTMLWLGVAGLCLLVAAFCARISAVGPFLVGLVLGVGPAVWVFLDFGSFVARLDDVPELWNNTTFGLSYVSFALFPVVGGALIGAALAGRWRRPKTVVTN